MNPADVPAMRRVLFLSGATFDLPLSSSLAKAWDAIARRLQVRVIARRGRVTQEDPRFRLVRAPSGTPAGPAFYALLPGLATQEIRRFRPDLVVTQSPFETFAFLTARPMLRRPPKLLVQVHGDWRTARLYGSSVRHLVGPLADRAAAIALRRADGTRAVGPFTARIAREITGREPVACYPAYFDLESFRSEPARPLPSTPSVAWVGVLERVKNLDGFVTAWQSVAARLPSARLVVVGEGRLRPVVDELVRDFPSTVRAMPFLAPADVARLLDASTVLVLPSRSEGTPRVVMEAFARGRPVVAARVGGVPDLVQHEHNGLLVEPEDAEELAGALIRVLTDRGLATRLATAAEETSRDHQWTPDRFADALLDAVVRMTMAA